MGDIGIKLFHSEVAFGDGEAKRVDALVDKARVDTGLAALSLLEGSTEDLLDSLVLAEGRTDIRTEDKGGGEMGGDWDKVRELTLSLESLWGLLEVLLPLGDCEYLNLVVGALSLLDASLRPADFSTWCLNFSLEGFVAAIIVCDALFFNIFEPLGGFVDFEDMADFVGFGSFARCFRVCFGLLRIFFSMFRSLSTKCDSVCCRTEVTWSPGNVSSLRVANIICTPPCLLFLLPMKKSPGSLEPTEIELSTTNVLLAIVSGALDGEASDDGC